LNVLQVAAVEDLNLTDPGFEELKAAPAEQDVFFNWLESAPWAKQML
jgi:hypothetical protein